MRILHLAPYFPPDRIGGVGEVVSHLHRGLIDAGHVSHVITRGTSCGDRSVERIAESAPEWALRVAGISRRAGAFDVVHCHQGEALGLILAMRLTRVSTPVLATFHVAYREFAKAHRPYRIEGQAFGRSWRNWWYRTFTTRFHRVTDRAALSMTDAVSFISRSSAVDTLGREAGRRARVIYNALPDLEESQRPAVDQRRDGLLYVGSPSDRKRPLMLPFVLRRVRDEVPEATLTIVGLEEGDVPELTHLFEAFGQKEHVRWVGRLRSEQITDRYRAARMVLVPSASEGLPMVILEALRCGTPCVVTRVSGHPEAIDHGVNGFLVDVDDPEDMAGRCLEILRDRNLGRTMGQAGFRVFEERFGLDRQVREYLQLYESVATRVGRARGGRPA